MSVLSSVEQRGIYARLCGVERKLRRELENLSSRGEHGLNNGSPGWSSRCHGRAERREQVSNRERRLSGANARDTFNACSAEWTRPALPCPCTRNGAAALVRETEATKTTMTRRSGATRQREKTARVGKRTNGWSRTISHGPNSSTVRLRSKGCDCSRAGLSGKIRAARLKSEG